MLNVTIMQLIDIFGVVLPGVILMQVGYVGNAGCLCGCGTACPLPVQRWACAGDIGYACSASLGEPFFGDTHRYAPCCMQKFAVDISLRVFMFVVVPAAPQGVVIPRPPPAAPD